MNINFLKKRALRITKFEKKDKKNFRYAVVYFSIATLIAIGMISAEILGNSRLKNIKKQQNQLKHKITNNEKLELQFLIFSNKLSLVKKIFEKRSNKQAAISYFTNIFTEDMYISGIQYDDAKQTLNMKVTSLDIFSLEKTFEILGNSDVKENFAKIQKDNLNRANDGKYTMSLNIALLSEGEKQKNNAKKE